MRCLVPAILALCGVIAWVACGDDGVGDQNNNTPGYDATIAEAGVDAGDDGGVAPDSGADAAVELEWTVTQVDVMPFWPLVAAHPTNPTTVALLGTAEDWYPNFEVWHSDNGVDFSPSPILSFAPVAGLTSTPLGLAFDPNDGARLVAALAPDPAPGAGQEVILAWSSDGGASFDYSVAAFTSPWPPDDMRFVGGSPSELVWRAQQTFHFSTSLGVSFERTAELDPLPAECDSIAGFDMPTDDHDRVAVWCDNGNAYTCDLTSDSCIQIPIAGQIGIIWLVYAPSNPQILFAQSDCDCGWGLFRSTDGGVSTSQVYSFQSDVIRIAPQDDQRLCTMHRWSAIHCSNDGGDTWRLMTPDLDPAYSSIIHDFAFASDGGIWGMTLNEVIHHVPW